MTDSVIEQGVRLRDRLLELADEMELTSNMPKVSSTEQELALINAQTCRDAAKMLQKMGTEVFRLRESIGHFQYGMMSRVDLIRIPDTWNGDKR